MLSTLELGMKGRVDLGSWERKRLECSLTTMQEGTGPSRSLYLRVHRHKSCILPGELDWQGSNKATQLRKKPKQNSIRPNYIQEHRDFLDVSLKMNTSLCSWSSITTSNTFLLALSQTQMNPPIHQQSLKCYCPFQSDTDLFLLLAKSSAWMKLERALVRSEVSVLLPKSYFFRQGHKQCTMARWM